MTIRESFVAKFGEDQAVAVERACGVHRDGVVMPQDKGSDPFRYAIVICIGFECMSNDAYRDHHGITAPWADIKKWIKESARLTEHDGDVDYLALFAGAYDEYFDEKIGGGL